MAPGQDRTGQVHAISLAFLLRSTNTHTLNLTGMFCKQPIQCRAAVAWEANKPLELCEVRVDPPGPGEVRVKASQELLDFTQKLTGNSQRLCCIKLLGLTKAVLQIEATALCHTDKYTLSGQGGSYALAH